MVQYCNIQKVEPPVLPVLQEMYEGEEKPEKMVRQTVTQALYYI